MYQFGWNGEVTLEGGNPWKPSDAPLVENRWIGGDYFKAMGIALRHGRMFDDRDRAGSTVVAILSESAASKFWPGEDPIGKRLSKGGPKGPFLEVVGVVHDVLSFGLTRKVGYELYVPIEQEPFGNLTVVLRTRCAGSDVGDTRRAARRRRGRLRPSALASADDGGRRDTVGESTAPAFVADVVVRRPGRSAGGGRRVRRDGLHTCGANDASSGFAWPSAPTRARVRQLVLWRGLVLGGLGIGIGAAAAFLLTRTMQAVLGDVKPGDPMVFGFAGLGLLLVTLLAGYLPARQASRTDPLVVLRID